MNQVIRAFMTPGGLPGCIAEDGPAPVPLSAVRSVGNYELATLSAEV